MSREGDSYEGLSLPQLLDRMHGVVEPETVSLLPQTEGWWVLLGWLLAVAMVSALRFRRYRRANQYRRDALQLLAGIEEHAAADPAGSAAAVAELVKRTALVAWPREQVASLYGASWAEFLTVSSGHDPEVARAAPRLARAAYDDSVRGAELIAPARRWISRHRA